MYKVKHTRKFKKDFRRIVSDLKLIEEVESVITLLATNDNPLPEKYRDHKLKGKFVAFRECHIRPDLLLVYQKNKSELILLLGFNPIKLPCNYKLCWTGMKVLKQDGSQHYHVGYQTDYQINRTIRAIKEGRDEALEKALEIAQCE